MLHSLTKLGDDNSWLMLARRAKPGDDTFSLCRTCTGSCPSPIESWGILAWRTKPGDDTFSLRHTRTGSCPLPIESWGILARKGKPGNDTFSLRCTRTGSSPLPVEFASRDLSTNNFRDNILVLTSDLVNIKFIARLYADDAMAADL
jgi:hypothetical protein